MRALETVGDPWDYRLPNEGDDVEIDADPYRLIGWLEDKRVEMQFDKNDPLRHQARQPSDLPGERVTKLFNLSREPGAGPSPELDCRTRQPVLHNRGGME